ncbi:MAG: hypothetical protein CM1200mP2_17200 [Planctomycetaceae bacterium]|nr:MAG: hypothetical protein CM1200mP2_17200 [Planctomycetaceae bacterium]
MKTVVKRGRTVATPQLGPSVHVEVRGLKPNRWYWYRFTAGDGRNRIGRTRNPSMEPGAAPKTELAFVSCQHYETGLFTGFEHMAKEKLDLVVHLGDYIYEYAGSTAGSANTPDPRSPRWITTVTVSASTSPIPPAGRPRALPWLVTGMITNSTTTTRRSIPRNRAWMRSSS